LSQVGYRLITPGSTNCVCLNWWSRNFSDILQRNICGMWIRAGLGCPRALSYWMDQLFAECWVAVTHDIHSHGTDSSDLIGAHAKQRHARNLSSLFRAKSLQGRCYGWRQKSQRKKSTERRLENVINCEL